MSDVDFVTLDDALILIGRLGLGPIRDVGLLDSALARPASSAFGEDAYPSLELKAAALFHSLVKNHALVDGNKRVAWAATYVFLRLNGATMALTTDDAFDLIVATAAGSPELANLARALRVVLSEGLDEP
ncbi:MAG: type II toxin-antitoxin system death-on-curing family toxin [Acidimicrobiales bacterium]